MPAILKTEGNLVFLIEFSEVKNGFEKAKTPPNSPPFCKVNWVANEWLRHSLAGPPERQPMKDHFPLRVVMVKLVVYQAWLLAKYNVCMKAYLKWQEPMQYKVDIYMKGPEDKRFQGQLLLISNSDCFLEGSL